jgi:16S rRNA (cytosine1402-N4)-methyltransferase
MPYHHISVMPKEAIQQLNCGPGKIIVDGTLGGAGHARAILERILPGGVFIGLDQDEDAVTNAKTVLAPFKTDTHLIRSNFENLAAELSRLGIAAVDGILLDLGFSLHQLEKSGRGFSFQKNEPLDMRMDTRETTTAATLVNSLPERKLADLIYRFGEEPQSRRIARTIVSERTTRPIRSSKELADLVFRSIPPKVRHGKRIHPATRTFMALRIAVNRELEILETFMGTVPELLNPGGRLCVFSFHSLEDRIVKQRINALADPCTCPPGLPVCVCHRQPLLKKITRKALKPSPEEVLANPMARSTRLRVAEKLPTEETRTQ